MLSHYEPSGQDGIPWARWNQHGARNTRTHNPGEGRNPNHAVRNHLNVVFSLDIDLLISIINAAENNREQALTSHCTLTRSFFKMLALALIEPLLWKIATSKSVGGGLLGIAMGIFAHLLDRPYEVGVSFLWPLASQRLGFSGRCRECGHISIKLRISYSRQYSSTPFAGSQRCARREADC